MWVVKIVVLPDRVERRFERRAVLDLIADALQDDERRVSFVQVPGRRLDAHGLEDADAADAEDDLLLDARLAVASVETRRELAIPRRVLLEIGVEEEEPHAAELHLPDRHEDGAIPERHGDDAGAAVGSDGAFDRRIGPVQTLVDFLLPAFGRHGLMKVALRVHEADADERNPEVARFLAVIAGQHAESARVNGQRLVERELGGEVRDRAVGVGIASVPPGVVRRARRVERLDRGVVQPEKRLVLRPLLEQLGRDESQHQHGVVRGLPPERVVELAKDLAGLGVPRPPEVVRELGQTTNAIRDRGSEIR